MKDYNELASCITTDNECYRITFKDGSVEHKVLYVHHDDFMGAVPCLNVINDKRDTNVHIPYPYYKLVKVESVELWPIWNVL